MPKEMTKLPILPIELLRSIFEEVPVEELVRIYLEDDKNSVLKELVLKAFIKIQTVILTKELTLQHLDAMFVATKGKNNIKNVTIDYNFNCQSAYENLADLECKSLRIGAILFCELRLNVYMITKLEFVDTKIVFKGNNLMNLIYKCIVLDSLTISTSKKVKCYFHEMKHLRIKELNLIGKFVCNFKFEERLALFLNSQFRSLEKLSLDIESNCQAINRVLSESTFRQLKELTITANKIKTQFGAFIDLSLLAKAKKVIILNFVGSASWSFNLPTAEFNNIEHISIVNIKENNNLDETIQKIVETLNWQGHFSVNEFEPWYNSMPNNQVNKEYIKKHKLKQKRKLCCIK